MTNRISAPSPTAPNGASMIEQATAELSKGDGTGRLPRGLAKSLEDGLIALRRVAESQPLGPSAEKEAAERSDAAVLRIAGERQRQLEKQVEVSRATVHRLSKCREGLEQHLATLPMAIPSQDIGPRFPKLLTTKWWAALLFAACYALSIAGAISNIVSVLLPWVQSIVLCVFVSTVWALLPLGLKIGISRIKHDGFRRLSIGTLVVVGMCGAAVWLVGLVKGSAIDLQSIIGAGVLGHMRELTVPGQLCLELASGYAFCVAFCAMLEHPRGDVPNPEREGFLERLTKLDREIQQANVSLGDAEGELEQIQSWRAEYRQAARDVIRKRFILAGVTPADEAHWDDQGFPRLINRRRDTGTKIRS